MCRRILPAHCKICRPSRYMIDKHFCSLKTLDLGVLWATSRTLLPNFYAICGGMPYNFVAQDLGNEPDRNHGTA